MGKSEVTKFLDLRNGAYATVQDLVRALASLGDAGSYTHVNASNMNFKFPAVHARTTPLWGDFVELPSYNAPVVPKFDDEVLGILSRKFPNVRQLWLNNQTRLTEQGFMQLAECGGLEICVIGPELPPLLDGERGRRRVLEAINRVNPAFCFSIATHSLDLTELGRLFR